MNINEKTHSIKKFIYLTGVISFNVSALQNALFKRTSLSLQYALSKGATLAVNEITLIIHNIDGTAWSCVHCMLRVQLELSNAEHRLGLVVAEHLSYLEILEYSGVNNGLQTSCQTFNNYGPCHLLYKQNY